MDWMKIIQIVLPAIIAGIGGWWGHWTWNRKKDKEAALREEQRQAEYDEFKKKRRLVGAGDVEKMQRAEMLTKLAIEQEKHGLTGEKWEQAKVRILGTPRKRTKAETIDPPTDEVGPNGGRIEYMPNGDKVEWINEDGEEWPMILRRNDNDILDAEDEFLDKVWWNRHMGWVRRVESGKDKLTEKERETYDSAQQHAKKIEERFGIENLTVTDFYWGMMNGKLSALRWVLGSEWDMLDS
jgi:hypothetical protein